MAIKKYPSTIYPDPAKTTSDLLLKDSNRKISTSLNFGKVTSGPAIKFLPQSLKDEIFQLAKSYGLPSDDFAEAVYWVVHNLRDYPRRCIECNSPVQFRSYGEAYMYERCSKKCSNSSIAVKDLKEQVSMEKYGAPCHLSTPEFQIKNKNTNLERYGVEHNMQRPEVLKKNMAAQYRLKPFAFPSGKVFMVQGYEPQALGWLLNSGYPESEISLEIPSIKYRLKRNSVYFADIYLPNTNTLVEVKSSWTVKRDIDRNKAKFDASVKAGYNHWLLVMDKKGNLLYESLKEV
jgi:hypothetical protein